MGQKTHPIGNRLGIIRGWDSNWYGGNDYGSKLVEDYKIREYLTARLRKASVANVIIERTLKLVTVTIKSARPGVIIGKGSVLSMGVYIGASTRIVDRTTGQIHYGKLLLIVDLAILTVKISIKSCQSLILKILQMKIGLMQVIKHHKKSM